MTPLKRRQMLIGMGLADPIPPIAVRRAFEHVDDRVPPEGEADGEFKTFNNWVAHASSYIGYTGARCFDTHDRPCRNGADMQRARDENAFPVRWYWPSRFAAPVIPSAAVMRLRSAVALAGPNGILVEELRNRGAIKGMTVAGIAEALEGRATLLQGRWTMSADGIAQTRFEIEQATRASHVR